VFQRLLCWHPGWGYKGGQVDKVFLEAISKPRRHGRMPFGFTSFGCLIDEWASSALEDNVPNDK
jgi:hypothetical protein